MGIWISSSPVKPICCALMSIIAVICCALALQERGAKAILNSPQKKVLAIAFIVIGALSSVYGLGKIGVNPRDFIAISTILLGEKANTWQQSSRIWVKRWLWGSTREPVCRSKGLR